MRSKLGAMDMWLMHSLARLPQKKRSQCASRRIYCVRSDGESLGVVGEDGLPRLLITKLKSFPMYVNACRLQDGESTWAWIRVDGRAAYVTVDVRTWTVLDGTRDSTSDPSSAVATVE